MNNIEERLERIEKKLDALLAERRGGGSMSAGRGDAEVDIGGPRGDPEVRFMPKRWSGPDRRGQPFSACEPEFLDLLAEAYEWFAQRDDETGALDKNGAPKGRWSRLDAGRARAWAARLRSREGSEAAPPVASERPRRAASAPARRAPIEDGDIPF